jgi:hypothetical protein
MKSMKRSLSVIIALSLPILGSCGGPTLASKTASAIQTLMANGAEAFLLGGGGAYTQECSGGGSFTYSPPSSIDPLNPVLDLAVSFQDCAIQVCGDELIFANSTNNTTFSLRALNPNDVAELIGGGSVVGGDDNFFEIEIEADEQPVKGFLKGNLSFGYRMRIIGNSRSLKEILIIHSETNEPAKIQNKSIPARDFRKLTDRC